MHYSIPINIKLKKLVRTLHQKQYRDQNSLFIAEGEKLCSELLDSQFSTELIIIRDSSSSDVYDIAKEYSDRGIPIYNAPKHQFDQMCETKSPQGILAVVNKKDFEIIPNDSYIALDGVQDPGNIGTIIRTAEWFGVKQIILGGQTADQYSPKTVRSTMGSLFRMNVICVPDLAECIKVNFKNIENYCSLLSSKTKLSKVTPKGKIGLIFGSESRGISDNVVKVSKKSFLIEGSGNNESLNVAVSAGVSLYHFSKFENVL
ncbi:MAG: RNA methyltransferase [Candidatus Kapabacteria bacterium]|nr:RNA methyltransferase [Candidatus Kapabacteria bacterium]